MPENLIMTPFDTGGRRIGSDRRTFSYDSYLPERRTGGERRSGSDRRSGEDRRSPEGFRAIVGQDRRVGFSLQVGGHK